MRRRSFANKSKTIARPKCAARVEKEGSGGNTEKSRENKGTLAPSAASPEHQEAFTNNNASAMASTSKASGKTATKMATPTSIARVFDIDKDDPDSWCSVGLLTNTECHQTILTDEVGLKSVCDLPAKEQAAFTARFDGDGVQTVCFHHRRFYLYVEKHKQGCLNRLHMHEGEPPSADQIKVTSQLAESCRDIVELEEGERLCTVCIEGIKSKQDSSTEAPSKRNSFAFFLASKKNQERAKRIDDIVTRCSVGLMTRSLCHMNMDTFEESVRSFSVLPYETAKILVFRLGRVFENICRHHEKLYVDGYGAPCCNPEEKHLSQWSSVQKWLVPRRFSLSCRGTYTLRPGRTVCIKCLKSICNKHPEVAAFYKEEEKEIGDKLAQLAEVIPGDEKDDQAQASKKVDSETPERVESSTEEWKYDSRGRRRRNITTVERQLRNLRVENPEFSDVLGSMDTESRHRQKRKVANKVKTFDAANYKPGPPLRQYNARGIHIASNKDMCDCLRLECPGCHFPCPKCGSTKCGDECRCNRNFSYDQIEIDGRPGVVYVNPLLP